VKRNHKNIVNILLGAGANRHVRNKDGLTPYDLMATNKGSQGRMLFV